MRQLTCFPYRGLVATTILAAVLAVPSTGRGFFQATEVAGVIGADVSGIWLAVYHVMPTFRVRLDVVEKTVAPFTVKPISSDLRRLFGEQLRGVQISNFFDPTMSSRYGLFKGDVITKLNAVEISDVASFESALKDVPAAWFLITVRRPQLLIPKARVLKISYQVTARENAESSEIGSETIRIAVLDGTLPFQAAVDEARAAHVVFVPSKEQIEMLRDRWYRLPTPDRAVFVRGQHRVVAAGDYDAGLRKDDNTRGTMFAIISTLEGNPMTGGGKTIGIYGVRRVTGDTIEGSYVESSMANAPFPISIEFNGAFRMTKIAPYSNKDVEYLAERESKQEKEEQEKVELAPDIPPSLKGD